MRLRDGLAREAPHFFDGVVVVESQRLRGGETIPQLREACGGPSALLGVAGVRADGLERNRALLKDVAPILGRVRRAQSHVLRAQSRGAAVSEPCFGELVGQRWEADLGPARIGWSRSVIFGTIKRHKRSYRGAALAQRSRNTLAVAVGSVDVRRRVKPVHEERRCLEAQLRGPARRQRISVDPRGLSRRRRRAGVAPRPEPVDDAAEEASSVR